MNRGQRSAAGKWLWGPTAPQNRNLSSRRPSQLPSSVSLSSLSPSVDKSKRHHGALSQILQNGEDRDPNPACSERSVPRNLALLRLNHDPLPLAHRCLHRRLPLPINASLRSYHGICESQTMAPSCIESIPQNHEAAPIYRKPDVSIRQQLSDSLPYRTQV